jgi:hypothetical protein
MWTYGISIFYLLFSMWAKMVLGYTELPFQWIVGALSLVVKQPRSEADHSPPTSVKAEKTWIYTLFLPNTFMA